MEQVTLNTSCTWNQRGCELNKAVRIDITHEDIFIRPELSDILSEEHAVLLTKPSVDNAVACELQLGVQPHYKIEGFHFACSAAKVEVFVGSQKEYSETLHGEVVDCTDDEEEEAAAEAALPLRSYRYDIEVQKSGIVELTLKFLTHFEEICIFGMLLQAAPNPNGITTLEGATINLSNVQQLLERSSQKLSPNAEKCKLFMEMYQKSNAPSGLSGANSETKSNALLEHMMRQMALKDNINPEHSSSCTLSPNLSTNELKSYIDLQLQQMENRLYARLDNFQAQQNEKLEQIRELLSKAKDQA